MAGKKIRIIFSILFVVFLALQISRPGIPNSPVTGDVDAPPQVIAILKRSCYNCHSNQTQLSWYDQIVPVYWKVRDHVLQGRAGLNFSKWNDLTPGDRNAKLWESVNQVIAGAMPLNAYTLVHPSAKVSAADMMILKNYLSQLPVVQPSDSAKSAALLSQTIEVAAHAPSGNIPVALNGIRYIPEYKNWRPISATNRFDNGTLRVITGNAVAVRAIAANHTNPWPDGTIFAKIAWDAVPDSSGVISTGAFRQVEFMIRDSKKYASTVGWGFARFKTPAMIPYGNTASYASECVNCHQPMKMNDFVFTIPPKPLPGVSDQEELRMISSWINQNDSTMIVVYADPAAPGSARVANWKEQPDEHWFGAKIPGVLLSENTVRGTNLTSLLTKHKPSVLP